MKNKKQNTIKYESEEETLNEINVNRKESSESCLSRKSKDSRQISLDRPNDGQEPDCDNLMENQKDGETVDNSTKDCDKSIRNSVDEVDDVNDKEAIENLSCFVHNVIVTNASVDMQGVDLQGVVSDVATKSNLDSVKEEINSSVLDTLDCIDKHGLTSPARSACVSPASSNGGVYSVRFEREREKINNLFEYFF